MNNAYQTMRAFWLDVKNLQHKEAVPQLGEQRVCVAGVEMAAVDGKGTVKNLLIAASSLGNASVYFENNSAGGIGGFTGGGTNGPIHEKALQVLQAAAAVAGQLPVVHAFAPQSDTDSVTLFTVSGDGQIRAAQLKEVQVRQREHPLYVFFAYTQQLLGSFRTQQEAAQKQATGH